VGNWGNVYVDHCTHSFIFDANKQKNKKLTLVNIQKELKMHKKLPDFVITDLYSSSLVLVEDVLSSKKMSKVPKTDSVPKNWFLGNNNKKITILVNEAGVVFLNEESLGFLTKILGACKLNMADVAVVNVLQDEINISRINKELTPTVCLLFDVQPDSIELPFTVPDYQIQNYGGCIFMMAPAISTYYGESNEAKLAKTKLWVSLKNIFKL
jgi:hypothetical protein